MPARALVIVDVQNDFLPGGALAVPCGDQIIAVINRALPMFELAVATQDWHPPHHVSFAASHPGHQPGDVIRIDGLEQKLWPVHCVQNTLGAALSGQLDTRRIARVFRKGTDPAFDSYSAFFDNAQRRSTGLGEFLSGAGVREIFFMGLATEYCVAASARDALRLGFDVAVVVDGCRGIEACPGDVAAALDELVGHGARLLDSDELPQLLASLPA